MNRIDDAVSIVGPEMKSEVEDIEKEMSLSMLEKSHFSELVFKSMTEAEAEIKKGVLDVEDLDINGVRDLFVGMFFKLLTDKGIEITQDDLSKQINNLLLGMSAGQTANGQPAAGTTKSEVVDETTEEVTPTENTQEIAKTETPNTEKVVEIAVEKIAVEIPETQEDEIMNDTGVALEAVKTDIETLKSLVTELSNQLKTVNRAASEEPVVVEKDETEYHELSKKFDALLKDSLTKEGDARKAGLQDVLNSMGNEFLALTQVAETSTEKSEVANQEVVRTLIDERIAPLANAQMQTTAQLAEISNLLKNILGNKPSLGQPVPVAKAVTMPNKLATLHQQPATPSNGGYSIADIVKKTVY